jgi:hypothetical protein
MSQRLLAVKSFSKKFVLDAQERVSENKDFFEIKRLLIMAKRLYKFGLFSNEQQLNPVLSLSRFFIITKK